jgi:plasmid stabilization system protein ParE
MPRQSLHPRRIGERPDGKTGRREDGKTIADEWRSGKSAPIGRDGERKTDSVKTHARVVAIGGGDHVQIVRILHQRMDPARHLEG